MKYHTVEDPDGDKITNPDDIPDDWIINAIDSWTDKSKWEIKSVWYILVTNISLRKTNLYVKNKNL